MLRALSRLLDVAGDLLGRRALIFHRSSDGRGYLRQLFDGAADFLDRAHRLLGRGLDAGDLLADLAGRFRGLLGQRLHLRRHDGEAAPGFASTRRLDGAFKASRFVCPAMVLISSTTSLMRAAAFDNSLTRSLVLRA